MKCPVDRLIGSGQLELLAAIVENKSFSKAASALGITQPSVSQHIKRLETICGRSLFRRSAHGVELTAHGEILIMYVRVMQALADDVKRCFDDGSAGVYRSVEHCLFEQAASKIARKPFFWRNEDV